MRRCRILILLLLLVLSIIDSSAVVPCDSKLVTFAILGAMNWIPKWFSPAGERSPKEIADAFASYLVRGVLKAATGMPLPPIAGAS